MGNWPAVAVYRSGCRARDKVFTMAMARSFAAFGRRSVIQPPTRLMGESMIGIGSGVFVGANTWLQVIAARQDRGGGPPARLSIGDGTSIAGHCVLSAVESVRIGRSVLIARNVYIADHSHAFGDPSSPILDQGVDKVEPVEVGDGAWLGQNCVLLPGVHVGVGAVVGANSVVRDDVPDRTVVVGAPAQVVRTLP